MRTYSHLISLDTFLERFAYLKLNPQEDRVDFGAARWMNQDFYRSREWRDMRNYVINRDNGCDLWMEHHDVHYNVQIHHMNPMTREELAAGADVILDPEYLISTSHRTHNAIHFGDDSLLEMPPIERFAGDTKLW